MLNAELGEGLTRFLRARVGAEDGLEVRRVEQLSGGASRENWRVEAEWSENGGRVRRAFLLRRDPPAGLLETDRATEYAVLRAVGGTSVPVPKVYWVEQDAAWLERPFCIMEWLDGMSLWQLSQSPNFPQRREGIARQFARILAQIHALDWVALGLSSLGPPGGGLGAADVQIRWWEGVMRKELRRPEPILVEALLWLKRNKPEAKRVSLVHGDYRSGNCLYGEQGIVAALDWEMAHLGDPVEDLAWVCMKEWAQGDLVNGLAPRERFLADYESAGGLRPAPGSLLFYEALANLKLAVIYLTGGSSFCEGRTQDLLMARASGRVPDLLREIVRLLQL